MEFAADMEVNNGLGFRFPIRLSSAGGGAEVGRSMPVPVEDAIVVCMSEGAS